MPYGTGSPIGRGTKSLVSPGRVILGPSAVLRSFIPNMARAWRRLSQRAVLHHGPLNVSIGILEESAEAVLRAEEEALAFPNEAGFGG